MDDSLVIKQNKSCGIHRGGLAGWEGSTYRNRPARGLPLLFKGQKWWVRVQDRMSGLVELGEVYYPK